MTAADVTPVLVFLATLGIGTVAGAFGAIARDVFATLTPRGQILAALWAASILAALIVLWWVLL